MTSQRVISDAEMLRKACESGFIDVLKWMVEHYEISKKDIIESCCFNVAISNNHKHIVEWIMCKFGIGKSCDVDIVQHACSLAIKHGYLDIFMTIMHNSEVTMPSPQNVRSTIQLGQYALQLAIRRHELSTAQIIIDSFELTYSDIEAYIGSYPSLCESKGLKL